MRPLSLQEFIILEKRLLPLELPSLRFRLPIERLVGFDSGLLVCILMTLPLSSIRSMAYFYHPNKQGSRKFKKVWLNRFVEYQAVRTVA